MATISKQSLKTHFLYSMNEDVMFTTVLICDLLQIVIPPKNATHTF